MQATTYSTKVVNTDKYSAMAEFQRRIVTTTKLKSILDLLDKTAKEFHVSPITRKGVRHPNVYTIGFADDNSEVTIALTVGG